MSRRDTTHVRNKLLNTLSVDTFVGRIIDQHKDHACCSKYGDLMIAEIHLHQIPKNSGMEFRRNCLEMTARLSGRHQELADFEQ